MTAARVRIGELLGELGARDSFTARRTATADDLHLEVKGIGRLRFPISRAQAERLCRIARPARYGQGEDTLLDPGVRDTWEIPKSRVKIDKRRWNRTLLPVLEQLRADLGLAEGCGLKAELHSMLVYAPGQFFLRHRDSEKDDAMVGTLVVTLPSRYTGGALVVEHQGETVTYRAPKRPLSFVAFYADCHHEVRPVKQGHRVTLTYNLMLRQGDTAAPAAEVEIPPALIDRLADRLGEHFETPVSSPWSRSEDAPPSPPPKRLIYLLDHRYTERGLGWQRLKGNDAARVAALRAAAERAGCEVMLALAEIQETWDAMEDDWDDPWSRRRRWERDEDDDWYADEPLPADDPDRYSLGELIEQAITLERWIDPAGEAAEPVVARVEEEEVCATTPTSELEPYASEYEGYMGNYGNTMDRWYRRAALVVWPRDRAFAVRAEASPAGAMETVKERLAAGDLEEARRMAASLEPFWTEAARRETRRGFVIKTLRVAVGLDRPELAASLLAPFRVERLNRTAAPAFAALVGRYGEEWTRALLEEWSGGRFRWAWSDGPDALAWSASLPRLCEALIAADETSGTMAARLLVDDRWRWLRQAIDQTLEPMPPSQRDEMLAELAKPVAGVLAGAVLAGAGEVRDRAVDRLTAGDDAPPVSFLVGILRSAATVEPTVERAAMGLDALREHGIERLEAILARPAREADDWSIEPPAGCACELCDTLADFLADPEAVELEWPLAKDGRKHVHRRLDDHELPVRHRTRRSGRPYTLVLTKERSLFARAAAQRRTHQADLAWLHRR